MSKGAPRLHCIALHLLRRRLFPFFWQLWLRACVRVCVSMCHCRALALTLVRREHKHTLRLASSIILFTRSTRDSSFRSVCSGWQFDVQQRWQTHCRCTVNSNACHMMNVQERVNFWFLSVFSSVSFFFFSFVIFTILIIINRYFSLDACDYTRREYFCFTSFDSKIWYFCLIPSFGSWILNKRNAGIVYFYSSFSCAEPDHHFSFFMEKKVSTFQIISTFKRNAMEKKTKSAHTFTFAYSKYDSYWCWSVFDVQKCIAMENDNGHDDDDGTKCAYCIFRIEYEKNSTFKWIRSLSKIVAF